MSESEERQYPDGTFEPPIKGDLTPQPFPDTTNPYGWKDYPRGDLEDCMNLRHEAWDEGFAAGRAAATPRDDALAAQAAADAWRKGYAAASPDERLREARTEYRVVGPRWQGTSYQHRSYAEDERRCMIDPARYRIEQRTVTTSDWVTVSDE